MGFLWVIIYRFVGGRIMGSFNEKKIGVGKQVRDNDNNRK